MVFRTAFVVTHAAAMLVNPGQAPFHGPPAVQHDESDLPGEFGDDLDADSEQGPGPVDQCAGVAGVGLQVPHARAEVAQPGQEVPSRGAVLDIGAGDQHADQQPDSVHGDMALAPVDLLARIEPTAGCVDSLGGLDRGRIDDPGARRGLATVGQPRSVS